MKSISELASLNSYFEDNKTQILDDFYAFLKFQSISSESNYKNQMLECIEWLKSYLEKINFKVEIWPTSGHPTLFASNKEAGPLQPTLLIYNHYDVQPVDPLNLWNTPPFQPTLIDEQIYARGAQDNKGQCFYVLLALKALMTREGKLPINIKLCIEGEEECGSAGFAEILQEKKEQLKTDYVAIVDLGIESIDKPAVTLGTRGIVTMDVKITGSHTDLHSGVHGGIAFNPIHALVNLLDSLRDDSGKINIPHFYDDVSSLNKEDLAQISLDFNEYEYEKDFGIKPTGGEIERSPLERAWTRPSLEINGINGGYVGEGFKTVIPAIATAKLSCRLVPNQDPQKIAKLIADFLQSHAKPGTKVFVTTHLGYGKAVRTNIHSKAVKAFAKAYEEVFDKKCEYIFSGASIPIVPQLADACQGEVAMVGLGLSTDCIHAPNEHFGIDRLKKGFLSTGRAIQILRQ